MFEVQELVCREGFLLVGLLGGVVGWDPNAGGDAHMASNRVYSLNQNRQGTHGNKGKDKTKTGHKTGT